MTLLLCIFVRRALRKEKKERKNTSCFPFIIHVHTENTVNFHNPTVTLHFPLFPSSSLLPPSNANGLCLPSRLFPDIRIYFLLSLLSFPLYLSICLSVCLSVTRHFTRSLTRSVSHTSENHSHSPRSLTRSLTRSRSHTDWVSFFFYSIHSDCTYVTKWTLAVSGIYCSSLPFHFSLSQSARKSR